MTDRPDDEIGAEINRAALENHEYPQPGKVAITITKPNKTQRDLSPAYTPGVAEPVRQIHPDPECTHRYTAKGNLVAAITDGSAVRDRTTGQQTRHRGQGGTVQALR